MLWLRQIGRWIIAMALQVLLVSQLQLWGMCHPFIYILPLLLMPITLPQWINMLLGLAAGLVTDVFCNTLGIHMAACVLLMFLRPYFIRLWANDAERITGEITPLSIGTAAFVKYVIVLVVLHHAAVFLLTAWSFHWWWQTLLTILISSTLTVLLLLGYTFLTNRR